MKATTAKTKTRFENILFATDFSPAAAHAIPFVKAVAHHFQSNLVVLHVKALPGPDRWTTFRLFPGERPRHPVRYRLCFRDAGSRRVRHITCAGVSGAPDHARRRAGRE